MSLNLLSFLQHATHLRTGQLRPLDKLIGEPDGTLEALVNHFVGPLLPAVADVVTNAVVTETKTLIEHNPNLAVPLGYLPIIAAPMAVPTPDPPTDLPPQTELPQPIGAIPATP